MKPARCHGNRDSRAAALTPWLLTEPVLTNKKPARWRVRLRRARNFHCNRGKPYQGLPSMGSPEFRRFRATPGRTPFGISGLARRLRLLLRRLLLGSLLAVLLASLLAVLAGAPTWTEAPTGREPASACAWPETPAVMGSCRDAVRRRNRRAEGAPRRERQHDRPDHRGSLPAPPVWCGSHAHRRDCRRILRPRCITRCRGRVPDSHDDNLCRSPVLALWKAYRRAETATTDRPQTGHRINT